MFIKFAIIGIINTIIHWSAFAVLMGFHISQGLANFTSFVLAASFSFFANAAWTFKARRSWRGYATFTSFMGATAYLFGYLAESMHMPPIVTLSAFSMTSLCIGYVFSKAVVFRRIR